MLEIRIAKLVELMGWVLITMFIVGPTSLWSIALQELFTKKGKQEQNSLPELLGE